MEQFDERRKLRKEIKPIGRRSDGFVAIQTSLLDSIELSIEEKMTLIIMLSYSPTFRICGSTVAQQANVSQNRMSRIFTALVEKGYLVKIGYKLDASWKLTQKAKQLNANYTPKECDDKYQVEVNYIKAD
jgi:DNA-binding MarR family transcriptional regulator